MEFKGTDMQIQYQRGLPVSEGLYLPMPHLKGQRLALCSPFHSQGKLSSKMQRNLVLKEATLILQEGKESFILEPNMSEHGLGTQTYV